MDTSNKRGKKALYWVLGVCVTAVVAVAVLFASGVLKIGTGEVQTKASTGAQSSPVSSNEQSSSSSVSEHSSSIGASAQTISVNPSVHDSPAKLAQALKDAFLRKDCDYIDSLMYPSSSSMSASNKAIEHELWDPAVFNDVKIVDQYEASDHACYQFDIDVSNAGGTAFSKGHNPCWYFFKLIDGKWYLDRVSSGGGSPEKQWNVG